MVISDVSILFFFENGLVMAFFRACRNTLERQEVLTIHRKFETMQSEIFSKNPVGRISRQQQEDFRWCIMCIKFFRLMGLNFIELHHAKCHSRTKIIRIAYWD